MFNKVIENKFYILLAFACVFVIIYSNRETFNESDTDLYRTRYVGKNLYIIQEILDKIQPENYKYRQNKKVTCLNFRNENAKYEFLNALYGNGTFDDKICILYEYFPRESSTSSYRFIINKSKKMLIKNSYSQNCLIN
jgi:hypothetical protein